MEMVYEPFGISEGEVADSMSPAKKTFGQQLFEWSRGIGVLLIGGALFFVGIGNKLADFQTKFDQMRADQAAQIAVENRRNELLNTLIQSQNASIQAQIDTLRLFTLPYSQARRAAEAEKIMTKLEQRRVSQADGATVAPGGYSR
jgi:hypothetical protein